MKAGVEIVNSNTVRNPEITRAARLGYNAALNKCFRPNLQLLKIRNNYTSEQAIAYLDAFDKKAARDGYVPLSDTTFAEPESINVQQAILPSFVLNISEQDKKELQERKLKHCKQVGENMAKRGLPCPDSELLKENHNYTDEESSAYIDGYKRFRKK
ncbi:MAG: hypothetical protein JSR17_10010 [Proteobacteria bacterium]|nr:hypothetical protein [Pseudomonadota bacterium]